MKRKEVLKLKKCLKAASADSTEQSTLGGEHLLVGEARADGRVRVWVNKVPRARVNAEARTIEEGDAIAAFAANFDPA